MLVLFRQNHFCVLFAWNTPPERRLQSGLSAPREKRQPAPPLGIWIPPKIDRRSGWMCFGLLSLRKNWVCSAKITLCFLCPGNSGGVLLDPTFSSSGGELLAL